MTGQSASRMKLRENKYQMKAKLKRSKGGNKDDVE
jgi:hypothetical protein